MPPDSPSGGARNQSGSIVGCPLSKYVTKESPEIYWKTNLGKDPEPITLSTEQTTLYALPSRYALGHVPKATLFFFFLTWDTAKKTFSSPRFLMHESRASLVQL